MFFWLTKDSSEYCSSKGEGAEGNEWTRRIIADHAAARFRLSMPMPCDTRNVLKGKNK